MGKVTALASATNGASGAIELSQPFVASIELEGTADLLFHRWNVESVEAKSKAAKGSAAKKQDDIESYVFRNDDGDLCIPGEYVRQAVIHAAKFKQDPRSPRKSAMDLFKAGVVSLTGLASLGIKEWDYEHKCRVQIQRSGITRTRPAVKKGWKTRFDLLVGLPEYIDSHLLHEVIANAGRLIGVGDFRPTYGRFLIKNFEVNKNA